jgi:amidohydrolase
VAETGTSEEARRAVGARIDALRPVIEDIAVSLFQKPELGGSELFAVDKFRSILEQAGFSFASGIAGMPTAFRAARGTGRPAIGFLAEYDALPGIGHGCGHNLVGACSLAAALACQAVAPAAATWLVYGTPAEETVGGKIAMTEAGAFAGLDAAFLAHPGRVNSLGGRSWASHPLELTFRGKSAHAGGSPQDGVNALDALVAAYVQIRGLRNSLRDDVRLAGIITRGGDAQNIIPDHTEARFTIRAKEWRYLEELVLPKVKQAAEGAALSLGASVTMRHHEPLFRETLEHPVLKALANKNFALLGESIPPPRPDGGVTDVGNVTWEIPCIQIGFAMSDATGHSRELAADTVRPRGIDATLMAAKVLALSALDLAHEPGLLDQAWRELRANKGQAPSA